MDNHENGRPSSPERRRVERVSGAIPVRISFDGTERSAMIHDLSATGVLFLTRARLLPAQVIEIRIFLETEEEATIVRTGRVVRAEKWKDGGGYWPFSAAMQFDEALVGHEQRIREINEHQKRLGLA